MLEDYGDDPKDLYPIKFAGKPQHERSKVNILPRNKSSKSRLVKWLEPSPTSIFAKMKLWYVCALLTNFILSTV